MAPGAVVQEYSATGPPAAAAFPSTSSTSISLSDLNLALAQLADEEAQRNGIERPRGYNVSWHHNPDVEEFHFGPNHPMKPRRLRLTKNLIYAYGMHTAMDSVISRRATKMEMIAFHEEDYIEFLEKVTPDCSAVFELFKYNLGGDCPVFPGLFDFCSLYTGASIDAARHLITNKSDIAINWAGGLHHAKCAEASGFCYTNDIVIAILELLRFNPRVLYIDIDVHHGDGVEQAFWNTDRVLTLSFHKYDKKNFFPGTGPLDSHGPTPSWEAGSYSSLNVPLHDGIEDDQYTWLFQQIVQPAVAAYRPTTIVLQCGADSLAGDRLGCFNLNIPAHGACVEFVKSFRLPLLVLGGGGYTPRNVARLWAYETSICLGIKELPATIPSFMPFRQAFEPDGALLPRLSTTSSVDNKNTRKYLQSLIRTITDDYLRYVARMPATHMDFFPPGIDSLRDDLDDECVEKKEESESEDDKRRVFEKGSGTGARGQLPT